MNLTRFLLPDGNIKLCATVTPEDYAELRLAVLDMALDGLNGDHTDQGKAAIYRIAGMFRQSFKDEVTELIKEAGKLRMENGEWRMEN